ncbi:hypothetical protein [Pantoea sp. UBA6567]|jgi:hypothetical protein|uniref:hypothetical protein n=1 Tax=Pantoea TaxID=53335 RepID=UPI002592F5EE|nr:hypothetical protein [Pantoea sp. UBA6567]
MMTLTETQNMQPTGFHYFDNTFVSREEIKGVINHAELINLKGAQRSQTISQYKIELWTWKQVTDIHAGNILTNVIITPVAAAADIIFFPISLTFFLFMTGLGAFK